jgi:hypothetical protein
VSAFLFPAQVNLPQRSVPIEVSTPLGAPAPAPSPSSANAPPKRRRIPITIVHDDIPQSQSQPPPSTASIDMDVPRPIKNDLLNPISSRALSPSTSTSRDDKLTPPAPALAPAPAPAAALQKLTSAQSFKEAKHAREAKSVGRVGGGIFRMSGNDTVFNTREVPAPAPAVPTTPVPIPASTSVPTAHASPAPPPAAAPRTLLEFTRAWDRIPATDSAARWSLLNVRICHPSLARLPSPSQHADIFAPSGPTDDPPHIPPSALRRIARTLSPGLAHPRARRCSRTNRATRSRLVK